MRSYGVNGSWKYNPAVADSVSVTGTYGKGMDVRAVTIA
jgi:hypothetical protein